MQRGERKEAKRKWKERNKRRVMRQKETGAKIFIKGKNNFSIYILI